MIEKKAGEEADANAEFEDLNFLRQRSCFLGFKERRKENFGGMAGQRAIVVDNEWDGRRIGDECFVAALSQVLLAEVPFEGIGERHEILHEFARGLSFVKKLVKETNGRG